MAESGKAFNLNLFKRLLEYTNNYRGTFLYVALAAILISVFGVLRPLILQKTIDESIVPKDMENLVFYILLMIGVLVLEVIFMLTFIFFTNWLGQSVIRDIRVKLFKLMLGFKQKYYDTSAVGRLTTRAVNDIETISSIFSQGLFVIISDLLKMGVIMGVMFYKSWQLTLIVFSILPIILYATRVFQRAMKSAFEEVRAQVANLNSFVQERITGMKIVQIFTREKTEYREFKEINEKHKKAWVKTVWYNSIFFPIAEMASSVSIGLVVWYGGLNAAEGGIITLGVIVAFIDFSQMLFRPLRQIADKFNTLQMGMVAARRVFDVLDTNSKIEDKGTLLLDKAPFDDIAMLRWRSKIGYVSQDPWLIAGTIEQNISFGATEIKTEEIIEAANVSTSSDFTNSHPKGFKQMLDERGDGLSGGQKQAITIARAIVKRSPILILDEPTSSMDAKTEKSFIERFKKYNAEATILLITHRTSLLDLVDKVIVVDKGKIVGSGSVEAFLKATKSEKNKISTSQESKISSIVGA